MGLRPEPVGPYSDVYAFGKTLVYCLFRRTELLRRDWRTLEAEAPGLSGLLERCLEDDPAERLQGFGPVLEALDGLESEIPTAPVREPAPTPAPPPRADAPPVAPAPPATQGWARPALAATPAPGWAQGPAAVGPAGWVELACLGQVRTLTKPVAGLAFAPDGGRLYVGLDDGSIHSRPIEDDDRGPGDAWETLARTGGGTTGPLTLTADGGRVLARQLGAIGVYASADGTRAATLAVGGSHRLTAYALDPASGTLVTADGDRHLLVWDLASAPRSGSAWDIPDPCPPWSCRPAGSPPSPPGTPASVAGTSPAGPNCGASTAPTGPRGACS